ncbi:hypothetical protein B0H11DRAFT_1921192 [Mycena galericulata]|nr:hypothetical protein B0H11DRAFT_1921192 [Mycena galericulata]
MMVKVEVDSERFSHDFDAKQFRESSQNRHQNRLRIGYLISTLTAPNFSHDSVCRSNDTSDHFVNKEQLKTASLPPLIHFEGTFDLLWSQLLIKHFFFDFIRLGPVKANILQAFFWAISFPVHLNILHASTLRLSLSLSPRSCTVSSCSAFWLSILLTEILQAWVLSHKRMDIIQTSTTNTLCKVFLSVNVSGLAEATMGSSPQKDQYDIVGVQKQCWKITMSRGQEKLGIGNKHGPNAPKPKENGGKTSLQRAQQDDDNCTWGLRMACKARSRLYWWIPLERGGEGCSKTPRLRWIAKQRTHKRACKMVALTGLSRIKLKEKMFD